MVDAMPDIRFAVGQPVSRKEDPKLLRGEGHYTDDLNLPGQAYAVFVRSRHAHGHLLSIDAAAARTMPGISAFSCSRISPPPDSRAYTGPQQRHRDGSPLVYPPQAPLATDRVRYVGEPLAVVVAETIKQAKDAAEFVLAEIDPLPSVTIASAAAQPNAPKIHDTSPDKIALDYHYGDSASVAAAFAAAAHVTRLQIRNSRIVRINLLPCRK